jgi:hypothetical protein
MAFDLRFFSIERSCIMKALFLCSLLLLIPATSVLSADTGEIQATQAPANVSITPDNLDFGEQVTTKPTKPRRVTITNTGGKKLYINSVVLGGDAQQDFTLSSDTCTGKEIEAGKSCVVDVVFTPAANDRRTAALTFTSSAVNSPQAIRLTGVGINSVAVPPSKSGRP